VKYIRRIAEAVKNGITGGANVQKIHFTCNICSASNKTGLASLSREVPSCSQCGSTVRMRAIVHVLSMELFGESVLLKEFPIRKDIAGVGMSDWQGYAKPLAQKLDYTNTYYHQEPKLDITSPPEKLNQALDFVISTDVFEHVLYPVSRAFENTRRLLKNEGVFVFTVPYTKEGEDTVEHFGELHDFEIIEINGKHILRDIDKLGNERQFDNLVFHGGPGSTLEMRVFSEKSLMRELANSGFGQVRIYRQPHLKYGIFWDVGWSLPIAARP